MAERAQCTATSENTCKYIKHQQIKKTTSSVWQHSRCKCSQHKQIKICICSEFLYLVVLWEFGFLNLQVYFSICDVLSSLGHCKKHSEKLIFSEILIKYACLFACILTPILHSSIFMFVFYNVFSTSRSFTTVLRVISYYISLVMLNYVLDIF